MWSVSIVGAKVVLRVSQAKCRKSPVMKRTLFDKIWDDHVVRSFDDGTCLLYIDRIFLHERTGSLALAGLQAQGRAVRNSQQVFCTMDHIVDTHPGRNDSTRVPGGS